MSRQFQDMHLTRDDWTLGEWIVVVFSMAVINLGIVMLAITFGSIIRF